MKRTGIVGLCLVVALTCCMVTVANASAANFIVNSQGNGKVVGVAVGEQRFVIPGLGTAECSEASGEGAAEATEGKPFPYLLLQVEYRGCFVPGREGAATVTKAMYDLNANGTLRVVEKPEEGRPAKPITIESQECKVTIGEKFNTTLGVVEYFNVGLGEVEVVSKLSGITASRGAGCPVQGVVKTAEFVGTLLIEEEGGEMEVK